MIVIDASAMVEAPHLLDVEVLSTLRVLLFGRKLDLATADAARQDHFDLSITRHSTAPLAERVWQLRHQFTSYDASYLALAESLQAPLLTCDAKLVGGGHHADVHLVSRSH